MRRMTLAMVGFLALSALPAAAQSVGFGQLYYEGTIVGTVVPPANNPLQGRDDLYAVMGGATNQLPVIAVAPGDRDYHGGHWAFHAVTWNTTPYLLDSAMAVLTAASFGDVTIVRLPQNDFKCPVRR